MPQYEDILQSCLGGVCEVRSLKNDLLFVGRLGAYDGGAVTVSASPPVPPVVYNTEAKLVLYAPGRGRVELRGAVCGSSEQLWKLDRLFELRTAADQRTHFRQRVSCRCQVLQLMPDGPAEAGRGAVGQSYPCTALDVSQGGLRIACRAPFVPGDRLRLTGLDLPYTPPDFAPACVVRWADRSSREGLYGCAFQDLTPREQEQVTRSVLRLQQLDLQSHRSRG